MTEDTEQQKIASLKEIADTNMKVSAAKNVLFELQRDETVYLEGREKRALERIQRVLDESEAILAKATENHEEVHKLCQSVSSFADFLAGAHDSFKGLLDDFLARSDAWDAKIAAQEKEFARIRKGQEAISTMLDNRERSLEVREAKIAEEKALIESRQAQIRTALETLNKKQKNG